MQNEWDEQLFFFNLLTWHYSESKNRYCTKCCYNKLLFGHLDFSVTIRNSIENSREGSLTYINMTSSQTYFM